MTARTSAERLRVGVRETALTLGALLGALGIALALAHVAFGVTPMIVLSGSMEPEISAGDLVVARAVPAAEIQVGDVVSVHDDEGDRITHRVVASEAAGSGRYALTLRGDANATQDPAPYSVSSADRMLLSVPYGGRVAAVLLNPGAWLLTASLILGAWALGERRDKTREEPEHLARKAARADEGVR